MCRRAGKGLLPRLYRKHKGRCHYCNREVVMERVLANVIVGRTNKTIKYKINEVLYECRFASVDHIIDIELGGTNDEDNVVLSCAHCNQKKNKLKNRTKRTEYKIIAKNLKFS
jgi:HNH endonuclease